jgi:hypothetical protein
MVGLSGDLRSREPRTTWNRRLRRRDRATHGGRLRASDIPPTLALERQARRAARRDGKILRKCGEDRYLIICPQLNRVAPSEMRGQRARSGRRCECAVVRRDLRWPASLGKRFVGQLTQALTTTNAPPNVVADGETTRKNRPAPQFERTGVVRGRVP